MADASTSADTHVPLHPGVSLSDFELAEMVYNDAWGKQWPYMSHGKISIEDIHPQYMPTDDNDDEDDSDTSSDDDDKDDTKLEYVCLHKIQRIARACGSTTRIEDTLVVRREYRFLLESIVSGYLSRSDAIAITGHPGIGKTIFLLYVLLYRLRQKKPTAIQLSSSRVIFFHEGGVEFRDPNATLLVDRRCWALADSNADLRIPCAGFLASDARIIQACPPSSERWRGWIKQKEGKVVVSDLPTSLEIGAILKECKLPYAPSYSFISKWGPCTRTILSIMRVYPDWHHMVEIDLEVEARGAAAAVCQHPLAFRSLNLRQDAYSVGSAVLFTRPYRPKDRDFPYSASISFIPTAHLADIFDASRLQLSNDKAPALFQPFSSHAFAKSTASWAFEKRVHASLCCGSTPLSFIGVDDSFILDISPSRHLLSGTLGALAHVENLDSFYWIPSQSDFLGIDGILADGDDVYAIQATTATDHDSPLAGLRKAWKYFDREVRAKRAWHIIVIADSEDVADDYASAYADEMEGVALGQEQIAVDVLRCVLSS